MEIQDFPNYLIFDDGKVFSKNRNKFLKSSRTSRGYSQVILRKDGTSVQFRIHRLVATHFIPNPDNLPMVDHINRDKLDNRVQNLRWSSRIDNNQNRGKQLNNTAGHKGISYHIRDNAWEYKKEYRKKKIRKRFKTKAEALCFKYIILLKIKSGLYINAD